MARPQQSLPAQSAPARMRLLNPLSWIQLWKEERFQRERNALRDYLQIAAPIGLSAGRLYEKWHETIAEPIQDNQKAANSTATFWWRVTEGMTRFGTLNPPKSARRYHKLFAEAIRNASIGSEIAKNGLRVGKSYEVSRGLGFLDDFVKQMEEAEEELGRLVLRYRLLEEHTSTTEPEDDGVRDGRVKGEE